MLLLLVAQAMQTITVEPRVSKPVGLAPPRRPLDGAGTQSVTWPRVGYGIHAAAAVLVVAVFVATVAVPLATFTTVLALFGFAHVASELRYVDCRFGARLGAGLVGTLAAILAMAAAVRLTAMLGWLPAELATGVEIALGALLVGVTAVRLRRRRWIVTAAAVGLAAAALLAPFETLLVFAILHNLTPLAFLAEALRGAERWRVLAVAALGFILLPLLICTGLPFALLASWGLVAAEMRLFDSGDLTRNLSVYVPASALYSDWALHAFSASVFAQCMHYVAVIGVLPRLIGAQDRPVLAWTDTARFVRWLTIGAAALAVGFMLDYGLQRQAYALAALVHAWLELPVFALALGGGLAGQPKPASA